MSTIAPFAWRACGQESYDRLYQPRKSGPPVMPPALVKLGSTAEGEVVHLERQVTIIGSNPACGVCLDSPQVSGAHALLVTLGARTYLRDLLSGTGVLLQGRAVREALLGHGDRIRIAEFSFEFRAPKARGESANQEKAQPTKAPAPLELAVEGDDDSPHVPVEGPIFVIGRRDGAELVLEDASISGMHAAIIEGGGRWHLYDLNSRHGTFLNERRTRSAVLSSGDLIRLGGIRLRCRAAGSAAAPAPPAAAPARAPESVSPGTAQSMQPRLPAGTTPVPPATPSAPAGAPTPHLRIQNCNACGFYLKPRTVYCPACGKWQRLAYTLLAAGLLVLTLLAASAAVLMRG